MPLRQNLRSSAPRFRAAGDFCEERVTCAVLGVSSSLRCSRLLSFARDVLCSPTSGCFDGPSKCWTEGVLPGVIRSLRWHFYREKGSAVPSRVGKVM